MADKRPSHLATVTRVYVIVTLFVALIFCLVLLFQFQMDASVAMRAYAGGEGLWAKAQKDAVLSLERYIVSHDEADIRTIAAGSKCPWETKRRAWNCSKHTPILRYRAGYLQGRIHPVDIEYAIPFFLRFQHIEQMARVIEHWTHATT